jgi:glycosyltransferase involved in cell wall biosynthesis
MKVLLLTFKKDRGYNLARGLEERQHKVTVGGITLAKRNPLIKVPQALLLVIGQHGKHDVIIADNPLYDGLAGIMLSKIDGIPMILYKKGFEFAEYEDTGAPKIFKGLIFRIYKYVCVNSDHIVYISEWLKDKFFRESPISAIKEKPYSIIHHAPDSFFLNEDSVEENVGGFTSEAVKMCYAGNFIVQAKVRGILLLFDAFSQVMRKRPDISLHLSIAGNGKYKHYLQNRVNELNLFNTVTFTGRLSQPALKSLYKSSEIFVYHSFLDACPTVVMEAQACGIPAVVTNTSGASELVVNGITGIVCEPTAEALANALIYMIENPSKRRAMGLQASKHVARNLSWEVTAQKFNEVLNSVISGRREGKS